MRSETLFFIGLAVLAELMVCMVVWYEVERAHTGLRLNALEEEVAGMDDEFRNELERIAGVLRPEHVGSQNDIDIAQ